MKTIKHILVAALLILISILLTVYMKPDNPYIIMLAFLILGFFIFNFTIRRSLSSKNYFTSKYNFFATKVWHQKAYDIPVDLMFEKVIDVINNSKLKLVETDNEKLEILAITSMTLISWGENIYISFETSGNETVMKFCSTTLFQIYSWGKNEKNYNILISEIDNSLII